MRLPDREYLNLHEPGGVRALLDEALARGLFPAAEIHWRSSPRPD
ncbi:hypothetical protein ACFC8N_09170 [Streptomyces sp. NPDC055966]